MNTLDEKEYAMGQKRQRITLAAAEGINMTKINKRFTNNTDNIERSPIHMG